MTTVQRAIIAVCCVLAVPGISVAAQPEGMRVVGKDIVTNGSFENLDAKGIAKGWNMPTEVFAIDDEVAHEGRRSLRIDNGDPNVYLLATASVPCEPGKRYAISAWIKTESVEGEDSGATICLEWNDAEGNWLGGFYPSGFKGTQDWQHLDQVGGPLSEGAASCQIVAYLRKGVTGRAWFDQIQVREAREPYLRTALLRPSYRGLVFAGDRDQVATVRALLAPDEDLPLEDMRLQMTLRAAGQEEVLARKPVAAVEQEQVDFSLDLPDVREGEYTVRLALLNAEGEELDADEHSIRVVPGSITQLGSYIDEYGRLIRHGEPFFPLGLYVGGAPKDQGPFDDADVIADSSFNCIMNYGVNGGSLEEIRAYLNHLDEKGLHIIYSIKDVYARSGYEQLSVGPFEGEEEVVKGIVGEFREHPAVLGWYLNDELPLSFLPQLEQHQQWVSELDPDHPTWVVLYQVGDLEHYLDTTDVMGVDPYPVPKTPLERVANWTDRAREAVGPHRGVWIVPQVFAWNCYRKEGEKKDESGRAPTYEEKRNMAWQAIIHGANGLVFYSFFDLKRGGDFDNEWEQVKRMALEIRRLSPVILSVEDVPDVSSGNESIHCLAKMYGGKLYVFAVNVSNRPHFGKFTVGSKPTSVRPMFEDRDPIKPRRDGFQDIFRRFEVHLYEVSLPETQP